MRCPYCGDSTKHFDHGHLSILLDPDSDKPMLFRCFRCNESGILGADVLEDLGVYVSGDMKEGLKKSFRRTYNAEQYNLLPKKYKIPQFAETAGCLEKMYYLNQRLGTEFALNDCSELQLIPSIHQFMQENHLRSIPDVEPWVLDALEANYLGFLSANRNRITFRCIRDNPKFRRYYKLILDPQNLSKNTFFKLSGNFELLYTEPVNVHIAEGTFDILSIRYNLEHPEPGNHLFYASCGFNFNSIIRYLVAKALNTDIHVHIYSDRDKSDREHRKYLQTTMCKTWLDHITIHRNQYDDEKDYGVPRGRIEDSFITLK